MVAVLIRSGVLPQTPAAVRLPVLHSATVAGILLLPEPGRGWYRAGIGEVSRK